MNDEQRERMLDRLLENQAHHDVILQKLEEFQMTDHVAITRLNGAMAALLEQQRAFVEQQQDYAKQQQDYAKQQQAFAEQQQGFLRQHHEALVEIDRRLIRLETLIEAFVRGSRHNGGGQES